GCRGIVAAVQPQLPRRRQQFEQGTAREALQTSWPLDRAQALRDRGGIGRKVAERQGAGDGEAGVVDLVAARERRERQIESRLAYGHDQALAVLAGVPVAAMHAKRRADRRRPLLDHLQRRRQLRADDAGHARLQNAGLLERDLLAALAEKALVVG